MIKPVMLHEIRSPDNLYQDKEKGAPINEISPEQATRHSRRLRQLTPSSPRDCIPPALRPHNHPPRSHPDILTQKLHSDEKPPSEPPPAEPPPSPPPFALLYNLAPFILQSTDSLIRQSIILEPSTASPIDMSCTGNTVFAAIAFESDFQAPSQTPDFPVQSCSRATEIPRLDTALFTANPAGSITTDSRPLQAVSHYKRNDSNNCRDHISTIKVLSSLLQRNYSINIESPFTSINISTRLLPSTASLLATARPTHWIAKRIIVFRGNTIFPYIQGCTLVLIATISRFLGWFWFLLLKDLFFEP